jgi:hypothetical protein
MRGKHVSVKLTSEERAELEAFATTGKRSVESLSHMSVSRLLKKHNLSLT